MSEKKEKDEEEKDFTILRGGPMLSLPERRRKRILTKKSESD